MSSTRHSKQQRKPKLPHQSRSLASPRPRACPTVMQSSMWVGISTVPILPSLRFKNSRSISGGPNRTCSWKHYVISSQSRKRLAPSDDPYLPDAKQLPKCSMKRRSRREASNRSRVRLGLLARRGRYRGRVRPEGVTFLSALYLRAAICRFVMLLKTPISAFMSSLRNSASDFLFGISLHPQK